MAKLCDYVGVNLHPLSNTISSSTASITSGTPLVTKSFSYIATRLPSKTPLHISSSLRTSTQSVPSTTLRTSTIPQTSIATNGSSASHTSPTASSSAQLRVPNPYNGYSGAACYAEGTSGKALTLAHYTDQTNMTVESCLDFCGRTQGGKFAGLENAQE